MVDVNAKHHNRCTVPYILLLLLLIYYLVLIILGQGSSTSQPYLCRTQKIEKQIPWQKFRLRPSYESVARVHGSSAPRNW